MQWDTKVGILCNEEDNVTPKTHPLCVYRHVALPVVLFAAPDEPCGSGFLSALILGE